jgi:hypothetical protein
MIRISITNGMSDPDRHHNDADPQQCKKSQQKRYKSSGIQRYLLFFLAGGDDRQLENSTVLDGKGEIRAEKLHAWEPVSTHKDHLNNEEKIREIRMDP